MNKYPRKYIKFNKKVVEFRKRVKKRNNSYTSFGYSWWDGIVYRDRYKDGTLSINIRWLNDKERRELKKLCDSYSNSGRFNFFKVPPKNFEFDLERSFEDNIKIWQTAKKLGYV